MPATILIVDDEQDLIDPLRFALEREGYIAVAVPRGEAALALVADRGQAVDLVLLDWMLPDMSGVEVCRELRGSERGRRLPVIIVSARDVALERDVHPELGIEDYVAKPFRMRELVQRVKAALARAQAAKG